MHGPKKNGRARKRCCMTYKMTWGRWKTGTGNRCSCDTEPDGADCGRDQGSMWTVAPNARQADWFELLMWFAYLFSKKHILFSFFYVEDMVCNILDGEEGMSVLGEEYTVRIHWWYDGLSRQKCSLI